MRYYRTNPDPVLQPQMARESIDKRAFYAYTLRVDNLAAGAIAVDNVTIEANSDFILTKMTQFSDVAGAPQTADTRVIPLVRLQLTDTGSSFNLFDEPEAMGNITGFGAIPFILPLAYRFARNATLRGEFTNFSAATTYDSVQLTLIGFRNYGPVESMV